MSLIDDILTKFRASSRVRVLTPNGLPTVPPDVSLPAELVEFYTLCGGVHFLDPENGFTDYRIMPPEEVVDIGDATCGEPAIEPPLSLWFAIGADDNSEHVAIDLHPLRLGRCYDVFHETYDEPESATVVASSFAELLERIYDRGRAYWFDEDFKSVYYANSTDG